MLRSRAYLLACVLTGLLALALPARAQDFYKGKTFTIVVGFSPAGGFDSYARVLARYIGNHIPGKPTVIVQNMPGAGSSDFGALSRPHRAEGRHGHDYLQPRSRHPVHRPAGPRQSRLPQILLGRRSHAGFPRLLRIWAEGHRQLGPADAWRQAVHHWFDRQGLRQLHQRCHVAHRLSRSGQAGAWLSRQRRAAAGDRAGRARRRLRIV